MRLSPDQKVEVGPRDEFVIRGVISPVGTLLRSVVLLREPGQAEAAVNRLTDSPRANGDGAPERNGSIPWHRVFDLESSLIEDVSV